MNTAIVVVSIILVLVLINAIAKMVKSTGAFFKTVGTFALVMSIGALAGGLYVYTNTEAEIIEVMVEAKIVEPSWFDKAKAEVSVFMPGDSGRNARIDATLEELEAAIEVCKANETVNSCESASQIASNLYENLGGI